MKKTLLLFFLALMVFSFQTKAQDYDTGIGFRFSPFTGVSVKHFVSRESAIEGMLSARWHGYMLTGLYERHQEAFDTHNLKFMYGAGGHFAWWDSDYVHHPWYDGHGDYAAFGLDGMIGLEYTFNEIPFSISLDWKPMFNLINDVGFRGDDVGLTIRYTIR
jgi:hypothetical protein